MKKYLIYICMLWAVAVSCDDDDKLSVIRPEASGEWTDPNDGRVYGWVRYGDLEWMTSNLKSGTPYYDQSYEDFPDWQGKPSPVTTYSTFFDYEADVETYGNLYTWAGAKEACPEGWRIPTDEDWKKLEMILGMSAGEANDDEAWRGHQVARLLRQGKEGTGIGLQLGGKAFQDGHPVYLYLNHIEELGYYWTSTEEKENGLQEISVYYRKIFCTSPQVYRGTTTLDKMMRARCVRDAR